MIAVLSLPFDTRERVRRKLEPLEHFPWLGKELGGRWHPLRLAYGPWPWMLILYSYEEAEDLVLVVSFQDGGRPPRLDRHESLTSRGGSRQALLARLLAGCAVEALDDGQARSRLARRHCRHQRHQRHQRTRASSKEPSAATTS